VKAYLVGGAVRDRLLGLPVAERDWVVVGATAEQMLEAGYRRADAVFPVFLHPDTGDEYALARRESKTGPGYKGFAVDTGPEVTLEEDLARRDLTINAMAEDADGRLIDPYHGREDLDAGLLRHVTPAFVEDPVRLLRVARFAARFGHRGFRVAHGTHALLRRMAESDDLRALRPERTWQEMKRAFAAAQPWRFFEVLHGCGALAVLVPELAAALGEAAAHEDGAPPPPLAALRRATVAGPALAVRFAALMQGAVPDPAAVSAFCQRLRVEREPAELLALLDQALPTLRQLADAGVADLVWFADRHRGFQNATRFAALLVAAESADPTLAPACDRVRAARDAGAAVTVEALRDAGLAGPALGAELLRRRQAAAAALETGSRVRDAAAPGVLA
jgi:tRNA nucleotidyltransferase (CCA-adding enzyme)